MAARPVRHLVVIAYGLVLSTLGSLGGPYAAFAGNILAQTSVTLVSGANLIGRALARTGAVTLDNNQVSFAACGAGSGAGGAPPPFPGVPVPTLSQWALMALTCLLVLAGIVALRRRRSIGH